MGKADIILVSMPMGPLFQPSIGLGLLKATLDRDAAIPSKILYLTLRFAERIGSELYVKISEGFPITFDLVGEWMFAHALFDPACVDVDGYCNDVLRGQAPAHRLPQPPGEEFITAVLEARELVMHFLDDCVTEILDYQPRIVGFTSMVQQHVASLALAKRIKAVAPEIFILMGGANCEGVMGAETVRQFKFVDAVVSGEGDLIFVDLVQRILDGDSFVGFRGVYTREYCDPVGGRYPNAPIVRDLDSLPYPDYDDYFEQFQAARLDKRTTPRLLFECSRGCWWGEKMHCTFCGLNGATLTYRSKSARRAVDELIYLTARYPGCPISAVDNILDMNYFKDFIPELIERDLGVELFFEVKANLKKEQVRLLRDAGVTMIQPGIESLSTPILQLMRKGVKCVQNIQLLKWCKEFGVSPGWNLLWGFPGEPPEEYAKMADLVPLLTHLQPPKSTYFVRLDRFSPNFDEAEKLGFSNVRPYPAYYYCYPIDSNAVTNLAYFFTFDYAQPQDVHAYSKPLWEQLRTWRSIYDTTDLFYVDKGTHIFIWDLRPIARESLTALTGLCRELYIFCDRARSLRDLQGFVKECGGTLLTKEEVEALLRPLLDRGLMVMEDGLFLSLAIPLGEYSPSSKVLQRLLEVVQALGVTIEDQMIIPIAKEVGAIA